MELRNIITFLTVVEKESFTKAAEELGYVQSTVSVQIQQLEEEIGSRLFERIGKQVSITASGQQFLQYANQIVQLVEKTKSLGGRPEEVTGRLRIGIVESLLEWILLECIPQFHKQFPRVSIETKTASGRDLFRMLKRNELDFIFLLDLKIAEKNCTRIFAASEDIAFVTHPTHPLAGKERIDLKDILRHPLIVTEKDSIYRQALEANAAQKDLYIAPFLEINNTSAIVRLLLKGVGVSFLPGYAVRDEVAAGNLKLLPVPDCTLQLWSQIFYHDEKWVTPQMEGLIRMIQDLYRY